MKNWGYMKSNKALRWHKFPEEKPDNLNGRYVVTVIKKGVIGPSSTSFIAFWRLFTNKDGVEERRFCGYARDGFPDSFYWLELPDRPFDKGNRPKEARRDTVIQALKRYKL